MIGGIAHLQDALPREIVHAARVASPHHIHAAAALQLCSVGVIRARKVDIERADPLEEIRRPVRPIRYSVITTPLPFSVAGYCHLQIRFKSVRGDELRRFHAKHVNNITRLRLEVRIPRRGHAVHNLDKCGSCPCPRSFYCKSDRV
eukprot:2945463-Rhodomonas_salina.1